MDDGDSSSCAPIGVRLSGRDVVDEEGVIDLGEDSGSSDDGGVVAGLGESKSSVSSSPSLNNSALQCRFAALLVLVAGGVVGIGGEGAVLGSGSGGAGSDFEGGCIDEGRGCAEKLFIRREHMDLIGGNVWALAPVHGTTGAVLAG
jgi:hypothetical protein